MHIKCHKTKQNYKNRAHVCQLRKKKENTEDTVNQMSYKIYKTQKTTKEKPLYWSLSLLSFNTSWAIVTIELDSFLFFSFIAPPLLIWIHRKKLLLNFQPLLGSEKEIAVGKDGRDVTGGKRIADVTSRRTICECNYTFLLPHVASSPAQMHSRT